MKTNEELLESLLQEHGELKVKYIKAVTFIHSDEGMNLPDNDRACLKKQISIMDQYLDILGYRIYNVKADIKLAAEKERKRNMSAK